MAVRVAVGDPQAVAVKFPADATGNVLVDVTREDGSVLVADAVAASGGTSSGIYSYTLLAAHVAEVDRLRLVFTGTIAGVERTRTEFADVVGAHYFTVDEMRALPSISASYTDETIEKARRTVEDQIESNLGTSLVERYRREKVSGDNVLGNQLRLVEPYVRRLLGIKVNGTALTSTELAAVVLDGRYLNSGWSLGRRNVEVRYVAGYSEQPDEDIKHAALLACRHRLVTDATLTLQTTTTITNEVGTQTLAVAGLRHPFGIPAVDAVVLQRANEIGEVI